MRDQKCGWFNHDWGKWETVLEKSITYRFEDSEEYRLVRKKTCNKCGLSVTRKCTHYFQ